MASYTFATLKANLQQWLEDDFADYETQLPDIIARAEDRCLRDLDLEMLESTDTSISTSVGGATVAAATDAIVVRAVFVNDEPLERRSVSYVRFWQKFSDNGQPLYFAHTDATADGGSSILLAPKPDAVYSVEQRITKRPSGLSDSTTETWLSNHAGDLLFAACVASSEWFDKAPEDLAIAEAEYQKVLAQAKMELRHNIRQDRR